LTTNDYDPQKQKTLVLDFLAHATGQSCGLSLSHTRPRVASTECTAHARLVWFPSPRRMYRSGQRTAALPILYAEEQACVSIMLQNWKAAEASKPTTCHQNRPSKKHQALKKLERTGSPALSPSLPPSFPCLVRVRHIPQRTATSARPSKSRTSFASCEEC
jgi:hypothetical protein